jgi:hypothetical protein
LPLRIVDPFAIALVGPLRAELLGNDLRESTSVPNLCARGRIEQSAREHDAQLDELMRRNECGTEERAVP